MNTVYFYTGFLVVWTAIAITAFISGCYVYRAIKTIPMAVDFFKWYKFYAIQNNPEWKSKVGIVHNYIAAFISVWGYDKNTVITHHAGVVYKPYIWKDAK